MNILVVDTQEILNEQQRVSAKNRLYYTLVRFEHRINGATLHFSRDDRRQTFSCAINVSVEGSGIISVRKSGQSLDDVMNLAIGAAEPNVARRVDWRAWLNTENLTIWLDSIKHSIQRFVASLSRRKAQVPVRVDTSRQRVPELQTGPHFHTTANQTNSLSN